MDVNKLVRENVKRLTPYSSARDEYKGEAGIFMDANENPFGKLNRYPDPYQRELKAAISKRMRIEEEKIFLGNGSDEIIDLCFRTFCNPGTDKALIFTPTYGMYEVTASINDVEVIKVPLNGMFQIDLHKTVQLLSDITLKLIFICSPNNPTSNSMNYDDVVLILSLFRGIVIIDEAYIDFSGKPSFLRLTEAYPNLIIMQTFSKAMGLAAARIGMAFSNPEIIHYFNKLKPPYNISTINQKAALKKLQKTEETRKQVAKIKKERDRLSYSLMKIKVTEKVFPSDANFLLVKVTDANFVYDFLLSRNIITRNRSSVVDGCLRITVGTRTENNKLLNAFKTISI